MGVPIVGPAMRKVFGTRNERMVKRYLRVVQQVTDLEDEIKPLTDQELRDRTEAFRQKLADGAKPNDLLPEVFAVAREAMDRNVGIRNIFNPDESFDPSTLPADARALYDEVKATIDSTDPAEPAPPVSRLAEVIAENKEAAIEKIIANCRTLIDWPVVWVHLLVWSEGEQSGFESTRIR